MIVSRSRPKIIVLGMITKMPVGGVLWQTLHYLEGLRRLGLDPYYIEAHARTPSSFMQSPEDPGSDRAAAFLDRLFARFGFADRWAFHCLHEDGRCLGMSDTALRALYREAALLLNLHGGTEPREEHAATGRLVYVGTDPVELEIELHHGRQRTIEFLEAHCAHFSFAENYGSPDCRLPVTDRFDLLPTRQPVVLDFWPPGETEGTTYTTVANWKQPFRTIRFEGEPYLWSKHAEFLKFVNVPRRAVPSFELALASYEPSDRALLEGRGWGVRDAEEFSWDLDAYRDYVSSSRAEFTVAKDQNVRFRSGWFSDRSATYLAAGRPVITQDTGFGNILPTGEGLFAFSDMDDVLESVDTIESDPQNARTAARSIAAEFFSHEPVLTSLLSRVGLEGVGGAPAGVRRPAPRSGDAYSVDRESDGLESLVIEPVSRRPLRLPEETVARVLKRPIVTVCAPRAGRADGIGGGADLRATAPETSVIVVTWGCLPLTRLCLESVLERDAAGGLEVIVVDNASEDATPEYLRALEAADSRVSTVLLQENRGFPAACNVGLERARGSTLVLLNNDTIVPPGWLERLGARLGDPEVGGVNPVTNRIGTEAEVATRYSTYGEWLEAAAERAEVKAGRSYRIGMLALFCFAMRRSVYQRIGPLDEAFGTGLFEDDDYSARLRSAGYLLLCAEDVLVHHFGEASFGELVSSGRYGRLFRRNRARFEKKWERSWRSHPRRETPDYERIVSRVRLLVDELVPAEATVAVVSRGDQRLLTLGDRTGWHFPRLPDGTYAGHYPADGPAAVEALESLKANGAAFLLIPASGFWWLEHYGAFAEYLETRCEEMARTPSARLFRLSRGRSADPTRDVPAVRGRGGEHPVIAPESTDRLEPRGSLPAGGVP